MSAAREHPSHRCPRCDGPRLAPHPAGFVFRHRVDCALLAAEDATAAADAERAADAGLPGFYRRTTDAERVLLEACGVALPLDARTECYWLTPSVRRRRWAGVSLDAAA